MRIAIGSDHAGYELKLQLAEALRAEGHQVSDLGCHSSERTDYPLYGQAVGIAVARHEAERGILICGSGIGISIAANRVPGVRAALVHEPMSARLARQHNDANVLCMGARLVGPDMARELVRVFLTTPFEGGRHAERVTMLDAHCSIE